MLEKSKRKEEKKKKRRREKWRRDHPNTIKLRDNCVSDLVGSKN